MNLTAFFGQGRLVLASLANRLSTGLCFVAGFLLTDTAVLHAQSVPIRITVKNATTKQPLPYATIYSSLARTGIYTDQRGSVDWTVSKEDTLTVSFLAYESRKIPVNTLSTVNEVLLNERVDTLQAVAVTASKKRSSTYRIGFYDDPTDFDGWGIGVGGIAVNLIYNNTGRPGQLKTLLIDLGTRSKQPHRALARVRVLALDKRTSAPGKDVLHDNIVFTIPKFSNSIHLDLRPYGISFPLDGLFLGVEFLGFETREGLSTSWKQQTWANVTSTRRGDYRSVGASWRFPDTNGLLRWMPITDGSTHKPWERTLFKIGADVTTVP